MGNDPADMKWEYELAGRRGTAEGRVANRYASTLSSLLITQFAEDLPDDAGDFEPAATVTFRKRGTPEPIVLTIAKPVEGVPYILAKISTYPDVFGSTGVRHFLADPELLRPFDAEAMSGGNPAE